MTLGGKQLTTEKMSIMCRSYRHLMSCHGLQQGFWGLHTLVVRWSRYSLFSVVLCFLFHYSIWSRLHVHGNVPECCPICWVRHSFLYYAWKVNAPIFGWVGINIPTIQERHLETHTGISVVLAFLLRKQKVLLKCCESLKVISCFYYLILRSFYDELSIKMNFTISSCWGVVLPCLLGTSVCCIAVLLFLCMYLNKEKYNLPSVYFSSHT